MAAVVGFAFLWLSVTPVGKLVFLLVVATIPNAMLCMTTTAGMVQKAAVGRKKRPPLAVKKQLLVLFHLFDTYPWKIRQSLFVPALAGLFLPPTADFLLFVAFQPAIRQARMGVAGNIRESALEILSDTHGRNRAKP